MSPKTPELRRVIGPGLLTLYGVGTIVGAGILVLLGKVIGVAGESTPFAFLLAALIASFTGLSYCNLVARFPYSAGESRYAAAAFKSRPLSLILGIAVIGSGILSAATIAHGFAEYLNVLVAVPHTATALVYALLLGAIAIAGIRETAWLIALVAIVICVALTVIGVLIVWETPSWHWSPASALPTGTGWMSGVFFGAFLAFYAFIGFEDLVNLAEEVKSPKRSFLIAIPLSLCIATAMYVLLSIVALGAATPSELAQAEAPFAWLLGRANVPGETAIIVISLVAITDGVLAQMVMAARVLHGLAGQGLAPQALGRVHPKTQTPLIATSVVIGIVTLSILWGDILSLARGTSALILIVFTIVNASLIKLLITECTRLRDIRLQLVIPSLGVIFCVGLLAAESWRLLGPA